MLFSLLQKSLVQKYHVTFSPQQLADFQLKQFRKLVAYAAQHSPYYKKIIKDDKIDIALCIPADFPVLTKQLLMEHFDDIVTDRRITKAKIANFLAHSQNPLDRFLDKYYIIHTSGSSGTIGYYVYTQDEILQGLAPSTRVAGMKFGQKLAYIGATRGHFAGITMISMAKKLPFLYKEVRTFDINSPFAEIIEELNHMQPTSISGYAFALNELAKAQEAGKLHISPRLLQSGGEPLSEHHEQYIQKIFKAEVANVYASSENMFMGIGKEMFDGMYLMEDNLLFEIKSSSTIVTNLYNFTLPLIRYQMSDHLRVIKDDKHLMPFTKIHSLVGRDEFVPRFLNDQGEEDFISPILLVEFFVEHLKKFQFYLLSNKEFVFRACLEKGLSKKQQEQTLKKIEENLHEILREKQMNKVKFTIKVVDTLWADPKTGKFKLILKK